MSNNEIYEAVLEQILICRRDGILGGKGFRMETVVTGKVWYAITHCQYTMLAELAEACAASELIEFAGSKITICPSSELACVTKLIEH